MYTPRLESLKCLNRYVRHVQSHTRVALFVCSVFVMVEVVLASSTLVFERLWMTSHRYFAHFLKKDKRLIRLAYALHSNGIVLHFKAGVGSSNK